MKKHITRFAVLAIRLAPYVHILEQSQGIIAEIVNPKYDDEMKTSFAMTLVERERIAVDLAEELGSLVS